ncbi:MAG TPA: acetyl-CoA synthase subunit delta, partial [Archaeoglobaceae archaeon]|nr:acetyl-CoA synthase subunit delta [Archaeoglobaceae archaeon]
MVKMTIEEFLDLLKKYNIESLEGVKIEGDLEIELDTVSSLNVLNVLSALSQELGMAAYHLARASQLLGYPIQVLLPFAEPLAEVEITPPPKEVSLVETEFVPSKIEYPCVIQEVTLGAKKGDGGTRKSVVTLGGEMSLPFYLFDSPQPNLPAITIDVFDMPVPLPRAVREHYGDVMENPAEWAKKAVKEFGADLITIHLVSTDPLIKDTPASEAVKVIEDILQAVDVPLVIGGCGNKEKDPVVL